MTIQFQETAYGFNFQSASMSIKVGENVVLASSSVKLLGSGKDAELLSVSYGSKMFAYLNLVAICGLRINAVNRLPNLNLTTHASLA